MDIQAALEEEKARKDIDDAPGYTRAQQSELSDLAMSDLTHRQLANRVRMLMRTDWTYEAVVVAARDRIAWLAKRVEDLEDALKENVVIEEFDYPGDAPESCGWVCRSCEGNGETADTVEHKSECLLSSPDWSSSEVQK